MGAMMRHHENDFKAEVVKVVKETRRYACSVNWRSLRSRARTVAWLALMPAALAACSGHWESGSPSAPILLFNGTGTNANDVAAIETILRSDGLDYATVDTSQLNQMGEAQMRGHRLLIVPGGNFIEIGNSLTSSATANVRGAVQHGLNYLGICAGGFFAGDYGSYPYNGLKLTPGVRFGFYAAEGQGIRKAAVPIATGAGAPVLEHYWEDGPQFTGWGAVVGTYPDGTPAIAEGTFGSGWVLLSGVHPEAPESWRRGMIFRTPASVDNAYALTLVRAALQRTSLASH